MGRFVISYANFHSVRPLAIEHALSCPCGGFPSIRHNELHDITAQLLTETCHGVGIEPPLQPLGGEQLVLMRRVREVAKSTAPSHHWCFQHREGCAQLPPWCTNGLPPSLPRDVTNPTAEPYSGFGANLASHCCVLLSCVSEDQGLHIITLLACSGKPSTSPALRVDLFLSTKYTSVLLYFYLHLYLQYFFSSFIVLYCVVVHPVLQ